MTVTCPGCKRTLNVPDSSIGKAIACPACKTPVQVEEKLEIMPARDVSSPPAAGANGPAVGQPASSCPGCGFPLLPTVTICNRCGTNRFTGEQDSDLAGYQSTGLQRTLGKSGRILTLLVGIGIVVGIYIGVTKATKWAGEKASDGKTGTSGKGEAGDGKTGGSKGGPRKSDPGKSDPGKSDPGKPGGGNATTGDPDPAKPPRASATDPDEDVAGRFEEAFALLMDPLPDARKKGRHQLALMGKAALPFVTARYSESRDSAVRVAMIHALVRIGAPGAVAKLAEAIGDEDDLVREEAIKGLASKGGAAAGLVSKALASEDDRMRSAAIRVAERLSLKKLVPDIVALLTGGSAQVKWQAARCLGRRMASEDAYPMLIAALDDKSLDVAVEASRALAGLPRALPLVLAYLEGLPESTSERDALKALCLVAAPILASRDTFARTKLVARVCADEPLPKVIAKVKRLLASLNVASRLQAMTAVRKAGDTDPPMPFVAAIGLMDVDVRIRTASLRYLAAFPSEEMALPLIIAMGDENLELAMSAALEVGRIEEKSVTEALRTAAKGVAPQRAVLAAGVLARQDSPEGAETLERAALRKLHVPSPIPAWAAYQLSLLGKRELADRFAYEAEAARSSIERVYYTAAAARLGNEDAQKKMKPMVSDRRTPPEARVELARLLSVDDPESAKQALLDMLHEPNAQIQIASLGALADLSDPKVIPGIMERIASFMPAGVEAAKTTVVRYGRRAESHVLASVAAANRRQCLAAVEILTRLADKTSKAGVEAVVKMMKARQMDASCVHSGGKALAAMTGRPKRPEWTWEQWAKVLGIKTAAAAVGGEEGWGWITVELPRGWIRRGNSVFNSDAKGSPTIDIHTERDPPDEGDSLPLTERRYKDSTAMLMDRLKSLAYHKIGEQYIALLNVSAQKRSGFTVGTGRARTKAAVLLFASQASKRTSYHVFLVYPQKNASWYAEIKCSAASEYFGKYKRLFEKNVARSIKIDEKQIK